MSKLKIQPVSAGHWNDLAKLFGPSGAYSGCWCMYLRESAREFNDNAGKGNRDRFRKVVRSGCEPGLLAYRDGQPVGWVAVAPREDYPRILRSPLHKPTDDASSVWAITCFFVAKSARGSGVASALLDAAVEFARKKGARFVEGYPIATEETKPQAEMWRGSLEQFERAGFSCIARRKPNRPIVRLEVSRRARRRSRKAPASR